MRSRTGSPRADQLPAVRFPDSEKSLDASDSARETGTSHSGLVLAVKGPVDAASVRVGMLVFACACARQWSLAGAYAGAGLRTRQRGAMRPLKPTLALLLGLAFAPSCSPPSQPQA